MNIRRNPVVISEKEEMPNIVISEDTIPKYRVNVNTEGGDINDYLA